MGLSATVNATVRSNVAASSAAAQSANVSTASRTGRSRARWLCGIASAPRGASRGVEHARAHPVGEQPGRETAPRRSAARSTAPTRSCGGQRTAGDTKSDTPTRDREGRNRSACQDGRRAWNEDVDPDRTVSANSGTERDGVNLGARTAARAASSPHGTMGTFGNASSAVVPNPTSPSSSRSISLGSKCRSNSLRSVLRRPRKGVSATSEVFQSVSELLRARWMYVFTVPKGRSSRAAISS